MREEQTSPLEDSRSKNVEPLWRLLGKANDPRHLATLARLQHALLGEGLGDIVRIKAGANILAPCFGQHVPALVLAFALTVPGPDARLAPRDL